MWGNKTHDSNYNNFNITKSQLNRQDFEIFIVIYT